MLQIQGGKASSLIFKKATVAAHQFGKGYKAISKQYVQQSTVRNIIHKWETSIEAVFLTSQGNNKIKYVKFYCKPCLGLYKLCHSVTHSVFSTNTCAVVASKLEAGEAVAKSDNKLWQKAAYRSTSLLLRISTRCKMGNNQKILQHLAKSLV